jgi:transposase
MKLSVRTTKTASGKTAVQVINYFKRRVNIIKHIGSASDADTLDTLKKQAQIWIDDTINEQGLFKQTDHFSRHYQYLGFLYLYAYEFIEKIYRKFNFHKHQRELFKDLVIARVLEPRSKRDSLEFLKTFVQREHSENVLYKAITKYQEGTKDSIENEVVTIAKNEFGFNFSFVLYDVTTLYFESFKEYNFQKPGFSKEHKHNQPQVVVGLVVTKEGFPISYQIFKGNTFEGTTFIPVLEDFKTRHNIDSLTVVADSAMLSKQNLGTLEAKGINYIISARLASLKASLIDKIFDEIKTEDGHHIRIDNLVVDFSSKRYRKDKSDLDKQIEKAKQKLKSTTTKLSANIKYLKNDKTKYYLNQELIDKNTKLLGLKGYVTNLTELTNEEIVEYYHNQLPPPEAVV